MFYHSFPRPKPGQDGIQKGLKILENFLKNGILLVPEVIKYPLGKNNQNEKPDEYYVVQSRFCITQIDISELKAHEEHFGGFHIEFTNDSAYSLGAMPVFYLPKPEQGVSELSLKRLASGYLYRLHELKTLCRYIQELDEMIKSEKDQATIPVKGKNRATGKTELYYVNLKQLRDVLDMLTMNMTVSRTVNGEGANNITACMDSVLGALLGITSLFYPTDKDYGGEYEDLYNFRQREWRITAGISVNGKRLDRELTLGEKKILMSIDSRFFEKEITYTDGIVRSLVEGCYYMPSVLCETEIKTGEKTEKKIGWKPVQEFVKRIIVPKEALEKARAVAEQNHFDPARVVDFVSAMELEAIKSEYEAAKNQRRIQHIRSAQALAEGMYRLSVENRVLP
jgi:hypothetical protein